MNFNLDTFVQNYLHTAQWVFDDTEAEFSADAIETAKKDCTSFIDKVLNYFGEEKGMELIMTGGQDFDYLAAHDFYLTRNGHGAGFWDKPEYYGSKEANILTSIAEKQGYSNVYYSTDKHTIDLD